MNLHSMTDIRFYENQRKLENRDTSFDFDTMNSDLFGSFLGDDLLLEKAASSLPTPFDMEDREWLNDNPLAIMKRDIQPAFDGVEGFSQRFVSDELIRNMINHSNQARMEFSIEQGKNKLDVNAVLSGGLLTCDIKPSSDLLTRRIKRLKQDIERDVSKRMHVLVEICVI